MKYGRLKQNVFLKGLTDIKNQGFIFFFKKSYRFFQHKILKIFANRMVHRLRKREKEFFSFQGGKLEYLIHPYNLSWINERTVEVPIVLDQIKESNTKRILEVGAVLQHYVNSKWNVLDKFEKGNNILNEDIIDFKPGIKYDLIVSISTLEHVGYDDTNNPEKISRAIDAMKCWLNKNGKIIATMPLGYNKYMDKLIFSGKLGFDKMYFMKRISKKNKWKQVNMDGIKGVKYNYPYNNANAVAIGIYHREI
jgi:hypothetical protein